MVENQRTTKYNERYKFTGKERDWESGYDFFGARFYSSLYGFWTRVDPLADKYANETPYIYCGGNPIMMIDPDGREKHNLFNLIKSFFNHQGFDNLPDIEDYIIIGAHGLSSNGKITGMSMSDSFEDEKEYHGINAVVSFIKKEVLRYSNVWKKNKENGEQTVIILNSCSTGDGENSIAKQMSEKLNDVVIVAPDSPTTNVQDRETAIFYQYGPRQKPTPIYKDGKLKRDGNGIPIYNWGIVNNWRLFLNGKMIGTIRGDQKLSHECIDSIIKATKETQLDTTK